MKCCICGKEINGYGNNPWPIDEHKDARCCDECNISVILKRLEMKDKEDNNANNNSKSA